MNATSVRQRRATPADAEVGQRVRARRLDRGLSQTELAQGIGVTFQQVQKYEKGKNRIGAGRLARIAETLEVPVTYFFGTARNGKTPKMDATILELMQRGDAVRLVQAFTKIDDRKARFALIESAEALVRAGK